MTASAWDLRIERAVELANTCSPATEILRFYVEIARFQKTIYQELKSARGENHHPDVSVLLRHVSPLLSLVKRTGPAALARMADKLSQDGTQWEELLAGQAGANAGEGKEFFARSLLQPYTEYLAGKSDIPLGAAEPICPFCSSRPVAGVLRGEGDGAKRSLICSLCATEWPYRRIVCPNCGEEHKDRLPVYTAADLDYVRVEACDACKTYVKSVDLTKNGFDVPVVDELATVALSIWADEHGYTKLETNLLGM
jgi:FdhE protein